MIVSKQKPIDEILAAIADDDKIFLVGCAKCATVCKSGGEEEIWRMQETLTAAGKEITGSLVIDEACHMLRSGRDLRSKKEMVNEADAILVLTCGAGIQSISASTPKKTVAGLNTLFLGNIRRLGEFEQKCSLCGDCILTETGGICPVTVCSKGLMNGPCGGMDNGRCEIDKELECAWYLIYERLKGTGSLDKLQKIMKHKDFSKKTRTGNLILEKETAR